MLADKQFSDHLNECKTRARKLSDSYARSATCFRYMSNFFKIITIVIATFVGTASFSGNPIFVNYIIPICGFVIALVGGINAAFTPEKKATIYMQSHLDLMDIVISIENINPFSLDSVNDKIAKYQKKISQVEMNVFTRSGSSTNVFANRIEENGPLIIKNN